MESARTVLITTSQGLVQTEELYCVSESVSAKLAIFKPNYDVIKDIHCVG